MPKRVALPSPARVPSALLGLLLLVPSFACAADDAWTLDHRYAPPDWQTAICLPDDWQKTLVGKDGALLYDYPGRFAGFGTKLTFGTADGATWSGQELVSARVPIVRTTKRSGAVEIVEEAFAVTPPLRAAEPPPANPLAVERVGATTTSANWATPKIVCDPAFRHIVVGYNQPVAYRFRAAAGAHYTVVFGLCEGWHTNAAQRVLDLQIEGKTRRTVDLIAEKGRNVPAVFAFDASDENGDGWIDVAVAAAANAPDKNTILNLLWIFRAGDAPDAQQLISGVTIKPPLARVECGVPNFSGRPTRNDVLLVRLRNPGAALARVTPTLTVESETPVATVDARTLRLGTGTLIIVSQPCPRIEQAGARTLLRFDELTLAPGAERVLAFTISRGLRPVAFPKTVAQVQNARSAAARFWRHVPLPYGHIEVPDTAVQAQLDASIRNIYQAREIKNGLPAFQVGPTCYRGLWVVDGSFLLEAVTFLGRTNEARAGIKYLMSFQRTDGGFMLIDGHWKETGIVLWAVARHAQLTGDRAWLRSVWPSVERGFKFIEAMRRMPPAGAPNAGLIPDGFSDGGLADRVPEYTNIYWTMAGMRAAIAAARWLGNDTEADAWQREYDDFFATFRRAAARDLKTDAHGNRYLPIRMAKGEGIPPQKAQWAFLHAVFPGKVFAPDDPLVRGNMAMLHAVEKEGLVLDTGWLKNGIWTYFGGFYGAAWLWLGDGDKAARTLYAFGNHASPLLCWREEQMPVGQGNAVVGDMPHNWASAEFIRLVRNSLALERGRELHLFEALPAAWAKPGAVTRLRGVLTSFGPLSLELRVAKDGRSARLKLDPPRRNPPPRIVLHLDRWSGRAGTLDLPADRISARTIEIHTGSPVAH